MASIAIIDTIGLTYDGDTLSKRGLGGSESAVILISKELAALGFEVTVFNSCIDKEAKPGLYDGVMYHDLTTLDTDNDWKFDVVISSRTVYPFLPPHLWDQFKQWSPHRFHKIKANAKLKVVWLHDTFCGGDHLVEEMIVYGDIDELFTLSDFQTNYITSCDHGKRRNFEVLKKHLFQTRNGIVRYKDEVDIRAKDPMLFVYNASVTKGMLPLVNNIWPRIHESFPQAKLKVIGGYYRFRENAAPDEQELTWRKMVADPKYSAMGIEFTGIIKQSEIAEILSQASLFLFPGAFPETFGISTLESLAYNTPLVTTRFGALEETAVENACYKIDYAIEPNSLYPFIDSKVQEDRFVNLTLRAIADGYLRQQKMYYCNIIKDVCGWDTVALQWKQHFFKKLGLYLSRKEYQKVSHINSRVQEVFGRRFHNTEETYIPRNNQNRIVVITPMYNAEQYIEKCIESVISQDYDNWEMFIIDDASTDRSYAAALQFKSKQINIVSNKENHGAVFNQLTTMRLVCNDNDIVMLLDGDDSLVNDNQIFHKINNAYVNGADFTYGSCWSMIDNIPLVSQPYPKEVIESGKFREHLFNWNMPYTHLRTFKYKLIKHCPNDYFQDDEGKWYKAGGDGSVFYSAIENAEKIHVFQDIIYNYNDASPINDYKVNGEEQNRNAQRILACSQ
jgi:glycosyltransferase involved in cell wall biosynthesis